MTLVTTPISSSDAATDQVLLERWCTRADQQALSDLLDRHREACWRVAYHLCGNASDAEDALQDAVIQVMRHARQQHGGSVRAWLLAIVANAVRTLNRQAATRRRREALVQHDDQPSVDDRNEALTKALARLPERYAIPLILTYMEGCSSDTVAGYLGLTAIAVRKRCERGLARLRTAPELSGAISVVGLPQLLARMHALPGPAPAMTLPVVIVAPAAPMTLAWMITVTSLGMATLIVVVLGVARTERVPPPSSPSSPASASSSSSFSSLPSLASASATSSAVDPHLVPAIVSDDSKRLASLITLPRRPRTLYGLIYDLEMAVPPTLTFEADFFALNYSCTMGFDHISLQHALDTMAAQLHVGWSLRRGHLTLWIMPGAAPVDVEDPPYGDVPALRLLIQQWCRDESSAGKKMADTLNVLDPETVARPFPALASDAALVAQLSAVLPDRLLDATPRDWSSASLPAISATILAGYLHLDQFAPVIAAQLKAMVRWQDCPLNADNATFTRRFAQAFQREALIEALGWIGTDRDVPLLTQIALDDSPTVGVKQAARSSYANARSLLYHLDGEATHFGYKHREMSIDALSRIGTPAAIQTIVEVVNDRTPYAPRGEAAWQLGRIGAVSGLPAIRAALAAKRTTHAPETWYQGDDGEAFGLLWAMGRLAPDGVHDLLQMLSDASVRLSVLKALEYLRDDRIAPSLLVQLQRFPERFDHDAQTQAVSAILAQGDGPTLVVDLLQKPLDPQLAQALNHGLNLTNLSTGTAPHTLYQF